MSSDQGSFGSQSAFVDTGSHLKFQAGPVVMTTQKEMSQQLLGVTRAATRHVTLWSADLYSGLFEQPGFIEVLKRFVLSVRQARVRILLPQLPHPATHIHPLLNLAERLPGTFELRTDLQAGLDAAELIVTDESAVLYRIHRDSWEGVSDINDPSVAHFYLAQFNSTWRNAKSVTLLQQAVE